MTSLAVKVKPKPPLLNFAGNTEVNNLESMFPVQIH